MSNTKLSYAEGFNAKNIVFSKCQTQNIPNSSPPISYKRINISVKNEDGSVGDLIFSTSSLFSFGVQEGSGDSINFSMPLCMWNKNETSEEEKNLTDTIDNITETCKEYLVKNRKEIEKYDLELSDLKKFNPLYWKRDRGEIVKGIGPTLYPKILYSKKTNKIITEFFDKDKLDAGMSDNEALLDPMEIKGKYCYATAAIKFESIYIGNKISLQVKLYEAVVKLLDSGPKRLLRPSATLNVKVADNKNPLPMNDEDSEEEGASSDGEGSISNDSDSDEEEKKKKTPPKKRIIKRKKN